MAGWITTDPALKGAPGGLHCAAAAAASPWLARGGRLFVAGDRAIECFAVQGETARRVPLPIQTLPGEITDAAYGNGNGCIGVSPDGRLLAVTLTLSPFMAVYDTASWRPVAPPGVLPAGKGYSLAFSPDGTLLAVTHDKAPGFSVYDTGSLSRLDSPATVPPGAGGGVCWSPDGTKLAIGCSGSPYLIVYRVSDWTVLYSGAGDLSGTAQVAAWSPDGLYLAVSTGTSLRVYTAATWASVVPGIAAGNRCCVWARDSARLYTAQQGAITYTEPGTWGSTTLRTGLNTTSKPASISPDGSLMTVLHPVAPYVGLLRIADAALPEFPSALLSVSRAAFWHAFPRS